MQDFRNLDVWKKAHELTLSTYRLTKTFPEDERFGLTSQLRRSAASIGANLAEGCGRGTDPDFARFVQTAMGSSSEVEYHFLLARDLDYMPAEVYTPLDEEITRIKRMLSSLLRRIRPNQ
ncbi:MAG: four helix bundle protein [Pirellulales bacterium]